eukprot:scaffold734_cov118-Cylindrotheca_fusiformis.AAC.2
MEILGRLLDGLWESARLFSRIVSSESELTPSLTDLYLRCCDYAPSLTAELYPRCCEMPGT